MTTSLRYIGLFWAAVLILGVGSVFCATPPGVRPVGKDGKPLNLDFEEGTLKDWKAEGKAFEGQPIKGDTVFPRRNDMRSDHQGNYWVGGFEKVGDDPKGTLTSTSFKVTQPWASFLVAGGPSPNTRVELVRADTGEVIYRTSGYESETLRPVVIDLQKQARQEIFIRIVDNQSGHWGHVNFDDFEFYAVRPKFDNEFEPAKVIADSPPADIVPFAGLSPQEACDKASLPPGFKMHVFAGEPDVKQPIAFCLDDRGRVWVAEGYTYRAGRATHRRTIVRPTTTAANLRPNNSRTSSAAQTGYWFSKTPMATIISTSARSSWKTSTSSAAWRSALAASGSARPPISCLSRSTIGTTRNPPVIRRFFSTAGITP